MGDLRFKVGDQFLLGKITKKISNEYDENLLFQRENKAIGTIRKVEDDPNGDEWAYYLIEIDEDIGEIKLSHSRLRIYPRIIYED